MSDATYSQCKSDWLRIASVLNKAQSTAELRALLLADTTAPYHSFDVLAMVTPIVNLGDTLANLIMDGLDEAGAPL